MSEDATTQTAPAAPAPQPEPTQVSAPAAAPAQAQADWLTAITDPDARGLIETKKYASFNDVAVAYRNMVKLHGRAPDVLAIPEEGDADGWNAVYQRFGRPDAPDNYGYTPPEGMEPNAEYLGEIRKAAFEAGITQKQFEVLAKANDGFVAKALSAKQAEATAQNLRSIEQMKQDFGGEKLWNEALASGERAMKALGLDNDTLDALDGAIGNHRVMKLLATIGRKVGTEDNFIEGVSVDGNGMSPNAAKVEIERLKGDKDFADSLLNPRHANHRANVEKWQNLQRVAYSGGAR